MLQTRLLPDQDVSRPVAQLTTIEPRGCGGWL